MTLSIVILNWNGNKYMFDCMESIIKQTYVDYEIIIVDNASTDGSGKRLKELYPNLTFIFNDDNYGFAKGMNIGIAACHGKYIALLNNDIYLKDDFFEKVVNKFDSREDISCLQGQAYQWVNKECTNQRQSGVNYLKHRVQGCSLMSDVEMLSLGPNGSFMLLRKTVIDNVINKCGYCYDEDFGTGWEDIDLWLRLQLFGHKTLFVPDIIAWHVGSASADEEKRLIDKSLEYQIRIFRNRYYVIKKNYTKEMMRKEWFNLIVAELCLAPYYLLKSPKSLKALWLGKRQYKNNKISVKQKRDVIRKNAVVNYNYIKTLYRGF